MNRSGGLGGSRVVLCRLGRGASDEWPLERTQRSAPPPSYIWALADGCVRRDAQRTGAGPIQGCSPPIGTGSSDDCPLERTQRSALPSPCISSLADGVLGSTPIGPGAWTHPPPTTRHPSPVTRLWRTIRGCPAPDIRLPSTMKHVSCGQRRGTAGAVIPPPSAIPP
jgi:hypothetical protein